VTDIAAYLTISPNWAQPITVGRRWQTSILRTEVGLEQRSGLFSLPRRKIKYQLDILDESEMRYVKRYLFKFIHQIWGIPIWPDAMILSVDAEAGQNILEVESYLYRDVATGEQIILLYQSEPLAYEIGTIAGFAETQIVLQGPLNTTWFAGNPVYPIMAARLASAQEITLNTPSMGGIGIEATEAFA